MTRYVDTPSGQHLYIKDAFSLIHIYPSKKKIFWLPRRLAGRWVWMTKRKVRKVVTVVYMVKIKTHYIPALGDNNG